jgi:hypothetical protein
MTFARALTRPSDSVLRKYNHSQVFIPFCHSSNKLMVSSFTRPPVNKTIAKNFPIPAGSVEGAVMKSAGQSEVGKFAGSVDWNIGQPLAPKD